MTDAHQEANLGQNDVKVSDYIGLIGENIADKVSHVLHPVIEGIPSAYSAGSSNTWETAHETRKRPESGHGAILHAA